MLWFWTEWTFVACRCMHKAMSVAVNYGDDSMGVERVLPAHFIFSLETLTTWSSRTILY